MAIVTDQPQRLKNQPHPSPTHGHTHTHTLGFRLSHIPAHTGQQHLKKMSFYLIKFKLKVYFLKIVHLSSFSTSSVPTLKPVLANSYNNIIIIRKKIIFECCEDKNTEIWLKFCFHSFSVCGPLSFCQGVTQPQSLLFHLKVLVSIFTSLSLCCWIMLSSSCVCVMFDSLINLPRSWGVGG